jgi:PAS domain-containing protein
MKNNILTPDEIREILSWEPLKNDNPGDLQPKISLDADPFECDREDAWPGGSEISSLKGKSVSKEKGEDFFRDVLNALEEAILVTDRKGRILFQNAVSRSLLAQSIDAIWKKPFESAVCLLDRNNRRIENPVKHCLSDRGPFSLPDDTVLLRPDGSSLLVRGNATPIIHSDGMMEGVVLNFHNATPGKKPMALQEPRLASRRKVRISRQGA